MLQEVLHAQLGDLARLLGSHYDYVGVGRDDGEHAGEAVPIFWRRDLLQLVAVEHFWLAPPPSVPGRIGWDAVRRSTRLILLTVQAQTRMATIATLQTHNGVNLTAVNTHFDDQGVVARSESAKLLVAHLQPRIRTGGLVSLMGDLNSARDEDAYQTITGHRYENEMGDGTEQILVAPQISFVDTRRSARGYYGEHQTFSGFVGDGSTPGIIDCAFDRAPGEVTWPVVMIADNEAGRTWQVVQAATLPNQLADEGLRFSDHRTVVAKLAHV